MTADRFEVDTDRLRAAATRLDSLGEPLTATDQCGPTDLGEAGLTGWACSGVLARRDADWTGAVRGLLSGYTDHADQLRAAADRYDDAERIVAEALREAGPC